MAYSTFDDVRIAVGGSRNLVELADLEETASGFGDTPAEQLEDPAIVDVVNKAIAEGDGVINAYVKKRYAVPLVAPYLTDDIKSMSSGWAARVLRRQRFKMQPIIEDQNAEEVDRKHLKAIADGEIVLGVEPSPPASSIIIDKAAPRDSTLAISQERMKGFI